MSLVRAPLVLLHAILYQMASTPPNKTPPSGRYDNTESSWIKIAPFIFKVSPSRPALRPANDAATAFPPRTSLSPLAQR